MRILFVQNCTGACIHQNAGFGLYIKRLRGRSSLSPGEARKGKADNGQYQAYAEHTAPWMWQAPSGLDQSLHCSSSFDHTSEKLYDSEKNVMQIVFQKGEGTQEDESCRGHWN